MATMKLVPSQLNNAASSYLTISSQDNMYTDTSSSTYATITNTNASTSNRYIYLKGFNFDDIPANAQVSSWTVRLKGYYTSGSQQTLYLCNNTTTQSGATATGLTTSTQTRTFSNGSLTWDTIKGWRDDFSIRINCRRGNRNTTAYYYIYGAEIEVTYTAETVHVTGVTLNKNLTSLEVGDTEQLTETVAPSNASDKTVSWSSSNTSVATVSSTGLVTAVGAGSATITVTTTDGGKTATCAVTVTEPTYTEYTLATTMVPGKTYLVANGNSGSVYLMSNEANGSRTLKGVAATVTNGKISITSSVEAKCAFECVLFTAGNDVTTTLQESGGKYIYCDNSSGLRFQSTSSLNRFWHYNNTKFWQFKSSESDGYSDASSEYKYYLQVSNGNFTDNHVSTTSIENSNIPAIYLFTPSTGETDTLYFKDNGSWVEATEAYKKVNGSWVLQTDLANVFQQGVNYVKGGS